MLAPATTAEYAQDHDSAVLSALSTLLGTGDLPRHARDVAQLPLSLGGLGLASAVRNSVPVFWASWADCLAVLSRRLPRVAQEFLDHLDSPTHSQLALRRPQHVQHSATPTGLPRRGGSCLLVRARP